MSASGTHAAFRIALVGMMVCSLMQASLAQGPVLKVKLQTNDISFTVIGDWGRRGGLLSTTPTSKDGFDYFGTCTANFLDAEADTQGAIGQAATAKAMEVVAAVKKAQFVVNTGDNFYECGVDSPLRFDYDWQQVYAGSDKPALKKLTWFNTIGNHDLPYASVPSHLLYAKYTPRFVFPSRSYAVDVIAKKVSVRFVYINTNPFISKYAKSSNKYFGPEINATAQPSALSAQLDWIDAVLTNSTADFNIVVGHHPVFGAASTIYGSNTSDTTPGSSFDLGNKDASGTPSAQRLLSILRKHAVPLYYNGHDHGLAHAVDPEGGVTNFVTSGAGSFPNDADACGANRPYVKYTNADVVKADCTLDAAGAVGTAHTGFVAVKITSSGITNNFYTLPNWAQNSAVSKNAYNFSITKGPKKANLRLRM